MENEMLVPGQTYEFCKESGEIQYVTYSDGEMKIHTPGGYACMQTRESFTLPLRVDLTAKTDSTMMNNIICVMNIQVSLLM